VKVKGSTALATGAPVLAAGQGTKVFELGDYRIGCLICADGSHTAAWETFQHDRPDLIFRQNNRGDVADGKQEPIRRCKCLSHKGLRF
jgi:predicted amidohydrolase